MSDRNFRSSTGNTPLYPEPFRYKTKVVPALVIARCNQTSVATGSAVRKVEVVGLLPHCTGWWYGERVTSISWSALVDSPRPCFAPFG